ncbi:MAG: FlgD immunoglobulin-like domain containing protein, partial [Candidatus Omnitrophota bacterium]
SSIWTRKYDSNGNEVWTETGEVESGQGIAVDGSGNVYVTGGDVNTWGGDIWTRKYDSNGKEVWTKTCYLYEGHISGQGVAVDSSWNVYVVGGDFNWVWIRKYGTQSSTNPSNSNGYFKIIGGKNGYINTNNSEAANFIYRATTAGSVTFKIYNLKGDLVKTVSASATGPAQIDSYNYDCKNEDGNSLSSGIYIVKAEGPGLSLVKKMAIIR